MEVKVKMLWVLLVLMIIGGDNVSEALPTCLPMTNVTLQKVVGKLQMFVDELPQMPKLYGYTWNHGFMPGSLTIGMFQKKWKFHRDLSATTVFAYGTSEDTATVPGPTIEAIHGVPTHVTWQNHLPQSHILPRDPSIPTAIPKNGGVPTVVHLHGGLHPPQSDGNANAWFTADFKETGPAWSQATYTYPNVHHAGNFWYHDHAKGLTRINLLAGLTGAYVIRDPTLEPQLNLPSGEFDQHLMIVDRSFNDDGSIYMNCTGNNPDIHPQWRPEYFGEAITVNGKAWPYLRVQRRKYRFRIINASNARYYNFTLSNGLSFTMIGADGSYLLSPVSTQWFVLSPSEIADVIIDFSTTTATESIMNNHAKYPYPDGPAVPDQFTGQVMKFLIQPGAPNPPDCSKVPSALKTYSSATTSAAALTRYITLYDYQRANETTHLYINGKRFEDPVTETPKSGSTEVWEVINLTADDHPLHLHLATSQAIKTQRLVNATSFLNCMQIKNDAVACNITGQVTDQIFNVPAYEKTWKNTVKIPPRCKTTVIVKFNLVDKNDAPYPFDATGAPGYLYHCHILDHEDNAMIRPLQIVA